MMLYKSTLKLLKKAYVALGQAPGTTGQTKTDPDYTRGPIDPSYIPKGKAVVGNGDPSSNWQTTDETEIGSANFSNYKKDYYIAPVYGKGIGTWRANGVGRSFGGAWYGYPFTANGVNKGTYVPNLPSKSYFRKALRLIGRNRDADSFITDDDFKAASRSAGMRIADLLGIPKGTELYNLAVNYAMNISNWKWRNHTKTGNVGELPTLINTGSKADYGVLMPKRLLNYLNANGLRDKGVNLLRLYTQNNTNNGGLTYA